MGYYAKKLFRCTTAFAIPGFLGMVLSGCGLLGSASVTPVIKRGAAIGVLESPDDVARVAALVPQDNSYANRTTYNSLIVAGRCISGSFAVSAKVATTAISLVMACADDDGYFSGSLDLSSAADGPVLIDIGFLKSTISTNPIFVIKRVVTKDTESPSTFTIPSPLTAVNNAVAFTEVEGATLYNVTFTPAGGGAAIGPISVTTPSVPVSSLTIGTTYTVSIVALDAAGNQSFASSTFTLIIQTNSCAGDPIPAAPVITSIAADMTSPAITNIQKPAVVGTSEAGALVTVYKTIKIGGVSATTTLGTTTANSGGAWTYIPASNFAEGTYDISARITNTSGINGFEGTPFKVIIDTTAPESVPPFSPGTQSFSTNLYVSLDFTPLTDFLEYRYAMDNVSVLNCTTTSSAVTSSFANGTQVVIYLTAAVTNLRAIICDKAGNASPTASATYTRSVAAPAADTTSPPVPTITSINSASGSTLTLYADPYALSNYNGYNYFDIAGTAETDSMITIYANSKKVMTYQFYNMGSVPTSENWNMTSIPMLPVGDYVITATVTKSSGNESAHSAPKTLKVVGLAPPCGGRGMTAYFYMPGLEDGAPVMGFGQMLNGSGTISLNQAGAAINASGGHSFSDIGVYLKITNEDGVDKVYGHIGDWQDQMSATSTTGWTKVTPSYSTSVMKRFEIPYSNVANTATTPLNGPALFHVFCPRERDDLPHNITSLEGRFLPQNCAQPRFQGEAAACGLTTNVPTSFSLKQASPVPSDGYNTSFASSDLPENPIAGRFTSAEVTGVCSVRNGLDRDDPTAEDWFFARDTWTFQYGFAPIFGLSWSPAAWDSVSGLWNKRPTGGYVLPSIGSNQVDWRKPVSFWVDSGVDPGFYWRASYVMFGNKQQPDVTPWWWSSNAARVPVSKLTTFEVDFKPGFGALPDCSCGLTESTDSTCRDINGSLRPTLAFKMSTVYASRDNLACPGYE